ncbi:PD-(D/E)XK nuclease family protein [Croceitalea sp. MTPC5]|uniref:PD-(D/E)XK nuclease family protein n=1 Tax=Croceitalea sp. MTPC5 TaxID=3056565 RepID=UPI002B390814|nr:PD-(D/E)XK nuclease family protein [Croceitalea sp. MTPC5]
MKTFLNYLVQTVLNAHGSFNDIIFVVPSIRSATFLKNHISHSISTPIFAPTILSIEEYITQLSQLQPVTRTEVLFDLYEIYKNAPFTDKDDFYTFSQWAPTLLADFDEIDRYLVPPLELFNYLTEIKKLKAWATDGKSTKLVNNYIEFSKSIAGLYQELTKRLLETHKGYQGLRYRRAIANLDSYLNQKDLKSHVFIGFNALNTAEVQIIQTTLETTNASIFWDLDTYFLNDPIHDASYFIKQHLKNWSYFSRHKPLGFSTHYLTDSKKIEITGIPKSISQTKFIGSLLKDLYSPNKTIALVLADESLLPAILNAIPEEVKNINITMGFPLKQTSIASFINQFLDFHINRTERGWYYKDLIRLLSNPILKYFLDSEQSTISSNIVKHITKYNHTYLTAARIQQIAPSDEALRTALLFPTQLPDSGAFVSLCDNIFTAIKKVFIEKKLRVELESVHLISKLFNQLKAYTDNLDYLKDLRALKSIILELITSESLDFKGSPIGGLQIMGMLETRTLDFDTVIITSVNEGILPAGKTNNSFIPYDVKKEFDMPTFKDKDAVYTYHFYRLLQRAKNIYLTYNTEPDVLEGGEKSRFINQLLTDENINACIKHQIATPKIPIQERGKKKIVKTAQLLEQLKIMANSGFSPSSLTNYITNPYTFYKQNVLKIQDVPTVEETIAPNTFGTIVHDVLEELYTPLIGQTLTEESLLEIKNNTERIVRKHFLRTYSNSTIDKGQNLIVFRVILKYILSTIDYEIKQIGTHSICIIGLEQNLKVDLNIPGLGFPVRLKGKLDRIEYRNGELCIIDYKTGNVTLSELEIDTFTDLITTDKKTKAFQLLCYAFMYGSVGQHQNVHASILPIKKINSGLLDFCVKEGSRPVTKNKSIHDSVRQEFEKVLTQLILEIFNPSIPFEDI